MNRKYSAEMRERALRMLAETRPSHPNMMSAVRHVAGLLGMSPETLRLWQRRYEVDAGVKPGLTTDAAAEIKRLQKENAELRKANEILKAARVNSTRQRNTIDDHLGGAAWRRSVGRGCRRIGGNRYGSCGRQELRSVRSHGRWDPRQGRSSRSCCRSAGSINHHNADDREH